MSVMMIGSLAACGTTDTNDDTAKLTDATKTIDLNGVQAADDEEELTEVITKSLGVGASGAADGVDKEETVYLISDASGKVQDTIVG